MAVTAQAQAGGGGLFLQRGDDVGAAHHLDLHLHPRVLLVKARRKSSKR